MHDILIMLGIQDNPKKHFKNHPMTKWNNFSTFLQLQKHEKVNVPELKIVGEIVAA